MRPKQVPSCPDTQAATAQSRAGLPASELSITAILGFAATVGILGGLKSTTVGIVGSAAGIAAVALLAKKCVFPYQFLPSLVAKGAFIG